MFLVYTLCMTIFLASGNRHKQNEIAQIFSPHEILIPKDKGIDFDPEENGTSFVENSLIKARALWNIVHEPVIADDSGICVELLNNAPGIYSARYAGTGDDQDNKLRPKMLSDFLGQESIKSNLTFIFLAASIIPFLDASKIFILSISLALIKLTA